MKLKIVERGFGLGGWGVCNESGVTLFTGTQYECAEFVLQQTGGEPEDCPAPDAWNCKYCRLTEQCKLHSAKAPKPFSELRSRVLPGGNFGCVVTAIEDKATLDKHFPTPADATLDKFFDGMIEHCEVDDPLLFRAWTGRNPQKHNPEPHNLPLTSITIDEGKPGSDRTTKLQYSTESGKLQVHHIAIVEKGDPGAVILDEFTALKPMTAEFATSLRDQYRKKYPHTELLLAVVKDAMRCGTITATTDWDTAEGAVRLRFVNYAGCQIAVRMHNGDITNVWINGESRYDAHQHN